MTFNEMLYARGFSGEEGYALEQRIAELDADIEVYEELGKVAAANAARAELAALIERIGPDGQEWYEKLRMEIAAYSVATSRNGRKPVAGS